MSILLGLTILGIHFTQMLVIIVTSHLFEVSVVKKIMSDLNVRLTGNPRTDRLRPELVSMYEPMRKEISETMSSGYILLNT